MKITLGYWRTRDGRKARVIAVGVKAHQPVVAVFQLNDGSELVGMACDDGRWIPDGIQSNHDLIAPWTEPRLRPWKPEEVPVGALMVNPGGSFIITSVDVEKNSMDPSKPFVKVECGGRVWHIESITGWTWKWPHEDGPATRPCSIMEDAP